MIFEDTSRRRWHITRRICAFFLFCALLWIGLYTYSAKHTFALPTIADTLPAPFSWLSVYTGTRLASPDQSPQPATLRQAGAVASSTFSLKDLQKQPGYFTGGFVVQSQPASLRAFASNAERLDAVMPDWYSIPTGGTSCHVTEHIDEDARYLLHQYNVAIIPRLANYADDAWRVQELRTLLQSPSKRSCLAQSTADAVRRTDSKGINIDFEGLGMQDRKELTAFFLELAQRLHQQNQLLTIDLPVDTSAFDLPALSLVTDGVILMAYDQHHPASEPGPIAAHDWVERVLEQVLQSVPREKLLLGTANYSYDWNIDEKRSQAMSAGFTQTMELASNSNVLPVMNTSSRNMRFGYVDMYNQRHEVWFLDANTQWNHHQLVLEHGLLGSTLWRLGTEDPLMWSFYGSTSTIPSFAESTTLIPTDGRFLEPTIDAFSLKSPERIGHVQRHFSETQAIVDARYTSVPVSSAIQRIGNAIPEKHLVLIFGQEPDALWTPRLLNFLKESSTPAIFLTDEKRLERIPELAKTMVRDGFFLAATSVLQPQNHTYNADFLADELDRTQQQLIALTQTKSTLFQAPFSYDLTPPRQDDTHTLPVVSRLGYVSLDIGTRIEGETNLPLDERVNRAYKSITSSGESVITVNGMNNEDALALMRDLIPKLQADGYTFVAVDDALGIPQNYVRGPATKLEVLRSSVLQIASALRGKQWIVIGWIFLFTNVLSVVRILFLAVFALRSKHEKVPPSLLTKERMVTVAIPAYNEEKTIRRTLESVQQNSHTNLIALVVNDGSTDKTSSIVQRMQERDPRIRLINKPNGGKFSALNLAFQEATTDIVVTIDADTILYPETINALIQPFENPQVDAACGNVEVGNIHNLLTGFQAVEYITSQNFDRRAFEELNCIGVVPGATGAWRRQRVLDIGGYESDTLVEDADVTLRLLKAGGKIVYAPEARSRTEAPANLRDLAKQRLRWSFGTFQCLRKHASSFFHGTLGWIALPNIFFFQILYPILSPIGDIVFLWALITGQVRAIIIGYFFFVLIDFIGSVLAFRLERRSPKLLLLLFIQRFFYRQFMYVIAFRSVIAILRGTRQGWNKLVRQGSVHVPLRPLRPRGKVI